jgi:hypothetical protein
MTCKIDWRWKLKTVAEILFKEKYGFDYLTILAKGEWSKIENYVFLTHIHRPNLETLFKCLLLTKRKDFHKCCEIPHSYSDTFEIYFKVCCIRRDYQALDILLSKNSICPIDTGSLKVKDRTKLFTTVPPELQTPELAQKLLAHLCTGIQNTWLTPSPPGILIQSVLEDNSPLTLFTWAKIKIIRAHDCPYYAYINHYLESHPNSAGNLISQMLGQPTSHQKLLWTQKAQQLENTPHHILWPKSG